MLVLNQNTLRGPNYWSGHFCNLIQTRLQLNPNYVWDTSMQEACQSFVSKHLSEPIHEANFVASEALLDQTAQLALALQNAAGAQVQYYHYQKTIHANTYNLVIAYSFEESGRLAIKKAIEYINQNGTSSLSDAVEAIKKCLIKEKPSVKMGDLIHLAQTLSIPVLAEPNPTSVQFGYGHRSKIISESDSLEEAAKLLKSGAIAGIPVLAVSGSNGKTTTTRLLAHIVENDGTAVGFTSSDGVYIKQEMIEEGDTTGPMSAQMVLGNPAVEVAVLECARGGIVRAGLGFNSCDIAIITNVQNDHLGISDIETLEDLARVKAVLVKALKPQGWAVLNASNPYTLQMAEDTQSNVAFFARDKNLPAMQTAIKKGIPVAYVENDWVVWQTGQLQTKLLSLAEIPITFGGTLFFMVENALAASLAAHLYGIATTQIAAALKTFFPSAAQTPGRMNTYQIGEVKLLVDFAHNADGFGGIRDYLSQVQAPFKIGIIVGTGDRKEEDTRELGRISAQMFDLTLIHQVKFLRGKTAEELVNLLVEGMQQHNPDAKWMRIPDAEEPLAFALALAQPETHITALSDVLTNVKELTASLGSGQR